MTGAELIAAERQRQIEHEGWTPEHDDGHYPGDMAMAGACYAANAASRETIERGDFEASSQPEAAQQMIQRMWPWDREEWKPKGQLRDLVRAGALIAAEIDRLQRAEKTAASPHT